MTTLIKKIPESLFYFSSTFEAFRELISGSCSKIETNFLSLHIFRLSSILLKKKYYQKKKG